MAPRLAWNGYGKAAVRLVKVERQGSAHQLHDLTVQVQLQGRFEPAHLAGDNSQVLATDTMKNTVYALARQGPVDPLEEFGARLGRRMLETCDAAERAVVELAQHRWDRAPVGDTAHPHAFVRGAAEHRLARVTLDRARAVVHAGLNGLGLLKTTASAFSGFLRDEYTTLKDTSDRIMASDVEAWWAYTRPPADCSEAWAAVRRALLETFVRHESQSVQHTLYAMGEAALAACPEISEIRLVLPNRHHLLVDLSPFGLDNPNQIFVATSEPFGRIEAVIARH